ncbi:Amino Acid/Auxin Permease (AAAP) Family [Phytophthora cinnamomi]|uniref:Amino Acid/Auxin Permease (AAAP) Family n=1 Tax=Phytophthora cinnamomi TaxID=4785 RepID=UPI003559460A|nr:Amino Acid/Auxin Permease (AAAP) Family [Phytophthora cinnamomi]
MPLRSSMFDPSVSSLGSARLTVQMPIDEEAEASAPARPELVKCPELLLTGLELEKRTTLRILHKKGRRFESPWEPYFVGIYAQTLFYYANLGDWPRAVVPLVDADVKAVDRIFRHGDPATGGDDCGPCWKVTSCSGRVVLFRAPSHEARLEWIEQIRQASGTLGVRKSSMDGKAALALARRLSRSSSSASSTSTTSNVVVLSPKARAVSPRGFQSRRRKLYSEDWESSESLRGALRMVEKQKKKIEELQMRLEQFEGTTKGVEEGGRDHDRDGFEEQPGRVRGRMLEARIEPGEGETQLASETSPGELDLDAMLDDAAMEMSKLSRDSAVSDVLSEDEDTPESEGEDEDVDQAIGLRYRTREGPQRLSLVDEPIESSSQEEQQQVKDDQQQAMELAEIARNLQSSLRTDPKPAKAPLINMSSSSSLLDSQCSFSDVTEFGLSQINSNGSNESIFSITQDDLFYDDDDDGEIERLSEFEASDSQFLEASGFLDSIHQVMKDFIVSSQPEQSRQPDQVVISDEIIAEIRQGIEGEPPKEADESEESHKQRTERSGAPATVSSNGTSPRIRSLFSHAKSARDFFSGDSEGVIRAPSPQTPKDLPSLLVEDTMSVVASILQSAGRDDKMLLLAPFLRVFGSRNRLSNLIRWAIEIEVASVINVATLFRSDDYASRLVSTYSKAIGSKFIRVALLDPIRQIFKLKIADMELNPHKEESLQNEDQADANAANLMRTCQNIIDSIMKNTNYIPSSYFHICSHLNSKVISRFDGSKEGVEGEDASTLTRSVIGGFLFLRFVCPAITTPHLYGLAKQLPPPETRRVLVLVTKLLFKTATGVKFGDREPDFKVLNPFIEKNSPAIQQLFANLAMSPSQDIDECFASDSRKIYSHVSSSQLVDDLEVIRSISEKNLSEIEKKLVDCDCVCDVAENFKTAVLNSADPLQKSSLSKKLSVNMKFLSGFGKKPRKQSDI